MDMYEIIFSEKAVDDILRLRKSEPAEVHVDVLSAYGHYDDK